ncbi:hypothetical protein L2E82_40735 [Cichorium intybus]|uniref:Uncharacterized protein n=1 Tax=Cichorium intybus TaxID=13427 RepID=A0ACB9AL20_CICIN|nr:hypothetical protein L2E82_40735 [Cichorium intybus]
MCATTTRSGTRFKPSLLFLLQATTTSPPRIPISLDAKTLDCTLLHLSVSSRNPSHIPPLSISRSHGLLKIIIHETSICIFCKLPGGSKEEADPKKKVVPILRAGLAFVEHVSSILPATKAYQGNETLLPIEC